MKKTEITATTATTQHKEQLEGQPIVSSYQELENLVQADCENLIALFGAEQ